jgi:heptosyltransferase-3
MNGTPRILFIRRDNIGDLACTTPLFAALRRRFPEGYICALVTSYNRAAIENNPALDDVFSYTKAKHLDPGQSIVACHLDRFRTLLTLRAKRFDYCVLAGPGYQRRTIALARWINARHVVGFVDPGKPHARLIDHPIGWQFDAELTEAEDVWRLASAFDIKGPPGPLDVRPSPRMLAELEPRIRQFRGSGSRLIGIHISARKPSQRWATANFAALMATLNKITGCRFLLLWAPGSETNPRHPGDDAKAAAIVNASRALPVLEIATQSLEQLIAAISLCDDFICPDGGAMHLAAAAGKPVICLFGKSSASRWRPWGVPYRLLQTTSQTVDDISVDAVVDAYLSLRAQVGIGSP